MKVVLKSNEVVDELPFCTLKKVMYIFDSEYSYILKGDIAYARIDGYEISFIIDSHGIVDPNSIKIV